ncbi:type II secretion system protein [Inhella sp.]|jgi:prepilin-type N-terminal cleavage/methylation domain-containing protein|uniref:type II secretion system protein n=2 Tax=Inhella sp. TaxID=1921806 RepID=UPI00391F682E
MRKTSGCCPPSDGLLMRPSPAFRARRGFTLLEMLVVMALLALVAGVAAPPVARWLENAELRGWRADVRARIERLPVDAYVSGAPMEVDAATLLKGLAAQPAGARLTLERPLRYAANGAAEGGWVRLEAGGQVTRWRVQPLTGELVEAAP